MTVCIEEPTKDLLKVATQFFPTACCINDILFIECKGMIKDPFRECYDITVHIGHVKSTLHFDSTECRRVMVKKGGL